MGKRKIIVITGAGSGLGAEFARQLAARLKDNGAEIWLIARSKEKLEKVKTEIESKAERTAFKIKAVPMDISGKAGVKRFNDFLHSENVKEPLKIELLINNAGFGSYGPFENTPADLEMEMIELNCVSVTGLCSACLPFMEEGSGIINTASLAAFYSIGNFAVYSASKAYVLNFSLALAAELKERKIKVLALCPGSVSTDFANVASNGARKEVLHGKSPVKTVRHCLKCYSKGKHTALWALKWKIAAFMSRFIDAYTAARFTYAFVKRPRRDSD